VTPAVTRFLAALGAGAFIGLAGCASLGLNGPSTMGPDGRSTMGPGAGAFQLSGRFAVRLGKDGGSGRIQWTHTHALDDLDVLSPIGQGLARIVRREGLYTLVTSDGRESRSTDPGGLTQHALGWQLPLDGLHHWIIGRAQPGVPASENRAVDGRLTTLEQAGWLIEYLGFHNDSGLPERMRVTRGALDLRLILEDWQPVQIGGRQ